MADESLETILAERTDLIYVPPNPVMEHMLDFGGAEAVAGVCNVAGTAGIHALTRNPLALTFGGPVIEKIGFFVWEALKALYKKGDKSFSEKFKEGMKGAVANLLTDIAVHDSIYCGLMYYGTTRTNIAPELLSVVSFLAALPPAAVVKHYGSEGMHKIFKQSLRLRGFKWETYYESRFILGGGAEPQAVFDDVAKRFELNNPERSTYNDIYFKHSLPELSHRLGVARARKVADTNSEAKSYNNFEIVYTSSRRHTPSKLSEYNYFYCKKEKARRNLPSTELRQLPRWVHEAGPTISFDGQVRYDGELRIALDTVCSEASPVRIVELKVYNDIEKLCEAMQYVMRRYQVKTTTHPKSALLQHLINI